jgi:hypothetical protein
MTVTRRYRSWAASVHHNRMSFWRRVSQRRQVRVAGASALGFGIEIEYAQSERGIVRDLIVDLEDRPVLFAPLEFEIQEHAVRSVLAIREELTRTLQRLPENSAAAEPIKDIRAACARFLHEHASDFPMLFAAGLGQLRGAAGVRIAELSEAFDVPVHGDLRAVLPPSQEEAAFLEQRTDAGWAPDETPSPF